MILAALDGAGFTFGTFSEAVQTGFAGEANAANRPDTAFVAIPRASVCVGAFIGFGGTAFVACGVVFVASVITGFDQRPLLAFIGTLVDTGCAVNDGAEIRRTRGAVIDA